MDRRDDGYELFEITEMDDLDFAAFVPMADAAWKHDYTDQARLDFDEAVIRKMAAGSFWVAVLACTADGSPVGFELALERRLRVRGRSLHAFYASVFTVSVDHRRKGLGRWILEGINELVFERRGADVIVSSFHSGHAGSPAVQSTFDRIDDWGVVRFHTSPIWSRRLDKEPLPPLDPVPVFASLQMVGELPEEGLRAVGDPSGVELPSPTQIDGALLDQFEASFAFADSFAAQYLGRNPASGTLLYDLGPGRSCLAGYNIMPMSINDHRLRPVGQLQFLLAGDCSVAEITRVVHHVALYLAERGCFALSMVDMGMVPETVLTSLGFEPSEDRITFAARGPRRTVGAFEGLRPPYFVDFT